MDHICKPQTGLSQAFKQFQRLNPFEYEDYEDNLHGVSVRDGIQEDLFQAKLAHEIKQVPYVIRTRRSLHIINSRVRYIISTII
jgi:hypothetical protein